MLVKWILLIVGILLVLLFVVFSYFFGVVVLDMVSLQFWSLVVVCVVFVFFFGFLIVVVCGYMVGLVGLLSSLILGIGIIVVILVLLLIFGFGSIEGGLLDCQNGKLVIVLVLFIILVVLVIVVIFNDNLQDFKIGYLVGVMFWCQQVVLIVGCIVGVLVILLVLELFYSVYGFIGVLLCEGMDFGQVLVVLQVILMMVIVSGIFYDVLNWNMIFIGVVLGIVLIFVDLFLCCIGKVCLLVLVVGLGIYLLLIIGMILVVGVLIFWLLENVLKKCVVVVGVDEEVYVEELK